MKATRAQATLIPALAAGQALQPSRRHLMLGLATAGLAAAAAQGPAFAQAPRHRTLQARKMGSQTSNLRQDDRLVLFTTAARLSQDGAHWLVPVHAWVSRPTDSTVRMAILRRGITRLTGRVPEGASLDNFRHRAGLLVADNKRNRRIVVRIAGSHFTLPPTAPNGHTEGLVVLDANVARDAAPQGRLRIDAILNEGDTRRFSGETLLVPAEGVSIISDIDDTVKISHVTNRARLLAATFLDDFAAVAGMDERYRGWADAGAAIHFLSSSPWHLYQPLTEHLQQAGFPPAAMTLKHVRLKDRTFLDLFRPGSQTKPPLLRALVSQYPRRRFVLVGDSGEEDPEVYAALMREQPDRVVAVYIRNVTGAVLDDQRFSRLLRGLDAGRWRLFDDAGELPQSLP